MRKIAFYGKGGIGKSTTVSNLSAALAEKGYTVLQIGCDPKADSTLLLHGNEEKVTVLDLIREKNKEASLSDMVTKGYNGTLCVEAGGPTPGLGCAGRGVVIALEALKDRDAFEQLNPDFVFYDILGDVVCGGFSMPIREGYANSVYIISSGELMSIHASKTIAEAVEIFSKRGYATLDGIIGNRRNVENETEKITKLSKSLNTTVTCILNHSETVVKASDMNKTVIEAFPDSDAAEMYRLLAEKIVGKVDKDA